MAKEKLGQCIVCGEFGVQGKNVFLFGEDPDNLEDEFKTVGWVHKECLMQGEEGAGPDDHGDDWKKGKNDS